MLQRRYDTVEAQRFLAKIVTRLEYETLDLTLARLDRDASSAGRRDFKIHSTHRTVVVTVYVSRPLGAIYVLGYHLERPKEPTQKQTETLKAYVTEIQQLERSRS